MKEVNSVSVFLNQICTGWKELECTLPSLYPKSFDGVNIVSIRALHGSTDELEHERTFWSSLALCDECIVAETACSCFGRIMQSHCTEILVLSQRMSEYILILAYFVIMQLVKQYLHAKIHSHLNNCIQLLIISIGQFLLLFLRMVESSGLNQIIQSDLIPQRHFHQYQMFNFRALHLRYFCDRQNLNALSSFRIRPILLSYSLCFKLEKRVNIK
ncbi:Hypothetical_protein [Hexamita inflata]|uniref:Hypothetical_protein n=1 Tax=Hexamita inflata TaxID=28002 RepID=A0AA86NGE7_9EUKA|nr:Hypothetical protein HINF_LOCUS7077 [Hexamita inflata]